MEPYRDRVIANACAATRDRKVFGKESFDIVSICRSDMERVASRMGVPQGCKLIAICLILIRLVFVA